MNLKLASTIAQKAFRLVHTHLSHENATGWPKLLGFAIILKKVSLFFNGEALSFPHFEPNG